MPNYEIRVSPVGGSAQKAPKPTNFYTWKCAFCRGTGLNPYGSGDRCPACHGHKNWEVEANSSVLTNCGRCAGTGRINYMGNWAPCTSCKGSGKI
jgi:DnaJ-class molecular chaperone